MATPAPELYDRKVILEVIERDCLGDPGSSGVIVGSQKVGKTHLLNHVSKTCNKGKDTVCCRLNIDNLEAAGFSDDSFLRLFLSELQEIVADSIRDLQTHESMWQDDLAKLQGVLEIAPGQREAIRASLDELMALREIDRHIQLMLERTEPLEPAKTFQVFNVFRRIRKRVVLVIDEFHRMMRETGFTNRLFAFLRGASMQGKILTLVSSPVHLMDPSLHGPDADDRYDRLNLFNHYQMQFLDPFTQEEAEGFLDWLPPLQPPLKAEDKRYICRLGGGSPYFLRKARDLFGRFRPQTEDKRREFESKWIAVEFEPDLNLLWKRCLPEERAALSDVAVNGKSESPLRAKLEREGYVMQTETGLQLFSTAFSEFVRRQPVHPPNKLIGSKPTATEGVSVGTVELISRNLISALGLASTEQGPIFKFEVTNTSQTDLVVRVACSIVDYSQATIRTYRVAPGKTSLNGYAVLRDDDLHKIQNARATNVNYRISYGPVNAERVLDDGQLELRVLPPNNFLMAVFDPATDRLMDFTWLIAVWVRKRGLELQKLLNEASKECQLDGYQASPGTDVREHTRKQVSALYSAVRKRGLQYQNNAQVYLSAPEHYIQEVRFAEQSLLDNSANCLDFAVLFASLLLVCRIDPLILFVPGHAIVGWKDGADGIEFLQTIGIAANAFGAAWEIGMQIYKDRKAKCDAYLASKPDVIEDLHDFAILVDIVEVCRIKELTKI